MRKYTAGLLGLAVAASFGVAVQTQSALASPAPSPSRAPTSHATRAVSDEVISPDEAKRRALRQQALNMLLHGKGQVIHRNGSTVMKVGRTAASSKSARVAPADGNADQYVELSREKTDKIFVVLAQFGNQRHPDFPDEDSDPNTPGPVTFDGPRHNQIPEPNRTVDNSTIWQPDYNRQHFQDLYFGDGPGVESVKTFYEAQSSNRYSVEGRVTGWVKVRYNEARYGRDVCGSVICSNAFELVRDAINKWVEKQRAKGKTDAQIRTSLQSYDQWDRNDYDHDGNFNEPDGYIDHFQIVHAGGDQADGDPTFGEDAIWSHRSKAFRGSGQGPSYNPDGGTPIGDTGLWVADYTMQPENGGLAVFAHEYGHDLGLPDNYDTDGGDNGVEWWDLMAQDRLEAVGDEGIGTRPAEMSAWDKLQLGWLDYETVVAGQDRRLNLGPHEYNSAKPQGVVVVLPKKNVTTTFVPPTSGTKDWWSGKGNDLNHSLTRQVTLPASQSAALTFQASWDIEDCGPDACDYAYVEVDNGSGFTPIPGSITNPAEGNGIDGTSDGWQSATFDLSAYAGKTIGLRFHYVTDGAAGGIGFFADDIAITSGSSTVFSDDVEHPPNGWTADGFEAVGASRTIAYDNYYIASNRSFVSYDKYLQYGPYNFGFLNTKPDWVEHFSYEPGLLVQYWDTSQDNNDTIDHPGEGLILNVDAHPRPLYNLQGRTWRSRIQIYDAPFSRADSHSFTLHINGQPNLIRGHAAVPTFDDSRTYWYPDLPLTGVKVPNAGVRITVVSSDGTSMRIHVSPSPTSTT